MDAQEAKRLVMGKYPKAYSGLSTIGGGVYITVPQNGHITGGRLSGYFPNANEAWIDAATRFSPQPETAQGEKYKDKPCLNCGAPVYYSWGAKRWCHEGHRPSLRHRLPIGSDWGKWVDCENPDGSKMDGKTATTQPEPSQQENAPQPQPGESEGERMIPAKIAHALWYEGGRLRTDLKASMELHPENWHLEGLQQRLDEWDKAAQTYFDVAQSQSSTLPQSSSVTGIFEESLAKKVSDIGSDFGCPAGIKTLDWIRLQLREMDILRKRADGMCDGCSQPLDDAYCNKCLGVAKQSQLSTLPQSSQQAQVFDELWKELIQEAEVEPSPEEEGFARWAWQARGQSLLAQKPEATVSGEEKVNPK